jgi:hypothetical protein
VNRLIRLNSKGVESGSDYPSSRIIFRPPPRPCLGVISPQRAASCFHPQRQTRLARRRRRANRVAFRFPAKPLAAYTPPSRRGPRVQQPLHPKTNQEGKEPKMKIIVAVAGHPRFSFDQIVSTPGALAACSPEYGIYQRLQPSASASTSACSEGALEPAALVAEPLRRECAIRIVSRDNNVASAWRPWPRPPFPATMRRRRRKGLSGNAGQGPRYGDDGIEFREGAIWQTKFGWG